MPAAVASHGRAGLERIAQGRAARISFTVTGVDGNVVDPVGQAVSLEVRRDTGMVLVGPGAAAQRTAAGVYTYVLSPAHTGQLDRLVALWTFTVDGFEQTVATTVEVAGGHLFELTELRAMAGMPESKVSDEKALRARVLVEQALEDAIQCALVPRYEREILDGERTTTLRLTWPRVSEIRSVTVNAAELDEDALDAVSVSGRILRRRSPWPEGYSNVVVAYEHGYPFPPRRANRAALQLARSWLIDGVVDDRAQSAEAIDGTSYVLASQRVRGAMFEIPEVERFIREYDHRSRH